MKAVKIKSEINHNTFGCSLDYFEKHINGKRLIVIFTNDILIRVLDEVGEEWTLFNEQYFINNQMELFENIQ